MIKATKLRRGNEERQIILMKGNASYHVYCDVTASDFHTIGHRELLESCSTKRMAESLYRIKVNFLKGYQYEEVSECLS
jgi:hypothetical protein